MDIKDFIMDHSVCLCHKCKDTGFMLVQGEPMECIFCQRTCKYCGQVFHVRDLKKMKLHVMIHIFRGDLTSNHVFRP